MSTSIKKDLAKPTGKYRYRILALLFFATTINYMDRSIFGVLGPTLQNEVFNWTDMEYGYINMAFKLLYAVGMVSMGAIIDKFGTRLGYTLSIGIWSVSGMLHALVRPAFGLIGFMVARAGLAFGEAGNFPAAVKTVAEWFPKRERAYATGIFNAGSNVGAILAPAIIPLIVLTDGTNWQYAFLTTGALSALWVFLWLRTYKKPEDHKKVSPEELAYINSDTVKEEDQPLEPKEKVGWSRLLPVKETWAFGIGKLTDAVWWFYLFWGGKFLFDYFGLNIDELAIPLILIYLVADIGSIGGGWLSGALLKRGWSVNKARKFTLMLCGIIILPVMFSTQLPTGFKVTDDSITDLSERIATDKKQVEAGKLEQAEAIPDELLVALKQLKGEHYTMAKELTDTATFVLGTAMLSTHQIDFAPYLEQKDGFYVVKNRDQMNLNQQMPAFFKKTLLKSEGDDFANLEKANYILTKKAGKFYAGATINNLPDATRTNNWHWMAVIFIALAAAGHQAWSANLFTFVSDVFPKKATASVTGIGGMIGALAGMLADWKLASLLTESGRTGYLIAFIASGSLYLVILLIMHLLTPKLHPLNEDLKKAEVNPNV